MCIIVVFYSILVCLSVLFICNYIFVSLSVCLSVCFCRSFLLFVFTSTYVVNKRIYRGESCPQLGSLDPPVYGMGDIHCTHTLTAGEMTGECIGGKDQTDPSH